MSSEGASAMKRSKQFSKQSKPSKQQKTGKDAPAKNCPAPVVKTTKAKTQAYDAVICASQSIAGPFIGGKLYGGVMNTLGSDVNVSFSLSRRQDESHWMGFTLGFPLDTPDNCDDSGLGVRYEPDGGAARANGHILLARRHIIQVKFPVDGHDLRIETVTGNDELPEPLRAIPSLCRVQCDLHEGANVTICGFGLPFSNVHHKSDAWLNDFAPIVGDVNLPTLLRRRSFVVLAVTQEVHLSKAVAVPFERFIYPYGIDYSFDMDRLGALVEAHVADRQWMPRFQFEDDEQAACARAMSHFMDEYWLYKASATIKKGLLGAYFVPKTSDEPSKAGGTTCYVVVRTAKEYRDQFEQHWARLVKPGKVLVHVRRDWSADATSWPSGGLYARILERPDLIDGLDVHTGKEYEHDLLLKVDVPDSRLDAIKVFEGRDTAEVYYKESEAQ